MKIQKNQLTERQRLFCEHYVGAARHCAALAARLAGYAPGCSHVTGCQLLRKPKIAATVRGLEVALAHEMEVDRQRVIEEMLAAFDMAKLMQNPATMIAAMRQIALMCGYFGKPGGDTMGTACESIAETQFQKMSDQELLALIAQGAAAS